MWHSKMLIKPIDTSVVKVFVPATPILYISYSYEPLSEKRTLLLLLLFRQLLLFVRFYYITKLTKNQVSKLLRNILHTNKARKCVAYYVNIFNRKFTITSRCCKPPEKARKNFFTRKNPKQKQDTENFPIEHKLHSL